MAINVWASVGGVTAALPIETLLGTANQLLGMNTGATAAQWKSITYNNATGQLANTAGTVGAPAYTFQGLLDSGWYLSAGVWRFAVTGIQRVAIDGANLTLDIAITMRDKIIKEDFGANIAAAATTDLATATGNYLQITNAAGATNIASLGAATLPAGTEIETKVVITGGSVTLVHSNPGLVLPSAANIPVNDGDKFRWRKTNDAAANWELVGFLGGTLDSSVIAAKGDIISGNAAGSPVRKAVGGIGSILSADPLTTDGLSYWVPLAYISGGTYANNAGDVVNDIDIAPTEGADSTQSALIRLRTGITKRLDANWVVGNNQGGLDTGAIGNNDYYIHLIMRPDTGVVDVLFSISFNAPTMPANYSLRRLIGWFKRVAGTIVLFHTYETEGGGIELSWDVPTLDINLANTLTTARRTDPLKVPLNFSVEAIANFDIFDAAAGFVTDVYNPDRADAAPANGVAPLANQSTSGLAAFAARSYKQVVRTSNTGVVAARSNLATVDLYSAATLGFKWARKNAL